MFFTTVVQRVEAKQWDGSDASLREIADWAGTFEEEPILSWITSNINPVPHSVHVETEMGILELRPNDWLICDDRKACSFWPMDNENFKKKYEVAE